MTDIDPLIGTTPGEGTPVVEPAPDRTPVGGVPIVGPKRHRRWWLRSLVAVVVLLAGYYVVSLWQVHRTGRLDQRGPVDAIVVMGAAQYDGRPSPQLAARLDHVVDLWDADVAPLVVVTGGKQVGDRFTEAQASARYLTDHGVPRAAILEENNGRNSYDSLAAVRELLRARGLRRVVLVSDPYHVLRARLTAEEVGLDASVSATHTSPVRGWYARQHELKEAAGVALGRIIGFHRLLSLTG